MSPATRTPASRTTASKQTPSPVTHPVAERRLLLLDGHSLAYRAFFALPAENFRTGTGQTTNAVYGFTAMLINLLRDEVPTHVAVAFDVSRTTFRSERFAEYKANRSSTPDDFRGQVDLIKDVLTALAIPFFAVDNFEADDIIATLATQAEAQGYRVLVTTGDRDAFQLVSENVTVLYPTRGVSELGRIDPDAVMTRYGLTPAQYPDFAALRGDPSDNLPSIPGVGEKTAAKWVREFGSLEALTDRVDEVKGKAGDALRAHLAHVLLNRQLTELIRDVPLDAAPDDLVARPWDREAVHRLFDELEFRVLRERLFATLTSAEPEAEEGFDVEGGALEPGTVRAWLDAHARDGRRVGIAVHGRLATWAGRDVDGIALAAGEPSLEARAAGASAGAAQAAYLDVRTLLPDDEAALGEWLADASVPKAAHDVKAALHGLRARGWDLNGLTSDTALAAYLARPGQRSFDLADLALRYLRRELRAESEPENGQLSLLGGGADALSADAPSGEEAFDSARAQAQIVAASAVAELATALDAELDRLGGTRLLAELELPLQGVLADLETAGVAVDREALAELEAEFAAQVKQAAQDAYGVIGKEINLGSPKQLQVVLFDELSMPKTKRTKTGYTTDADALQTLFEQTEHPFLSHLLVHRDATRLKVTVEGLLKSIADDGRIHTTYSQTIAATGRLSSTEPNLQNVPDPHGGGAADPRDVRRRRRVRGADDGRLQPDRDADHGAPVGRRGPDRGVPQPSRLPRRDRRAGVRGRRRGGRARTPRQDQGDELRPGVRAVGLRAEQPAADLHGGGPRPDGRLLPDLRRCARLPRRRRRPGAEGRLHRDDPRQAPLPAGPDQRTTGSAARWPSGWRSTPRSRAARPTSSRSRCSTCDRALAAEGMRSRMLLQVHDELVLEVAEGERAAVEELVRREMGAAHAAVGAAGGVGGLRPQLGRGRALRRTRSNPVDIRAGHGRRCRGGAARMGRPAARPPPPDPRHRHVRRREDDGGGRAVGPPRHPAHRHRRALPRSRLGAAPRVRRRRRCFRRARGVGHRVAVLRGPPTAAGPRGPAGLARPDPRGGDAADRAADAPPAAAARRAVERQRRTAAVDAAHRSGPHPALGLAHP